MASNALFHSIASKPRIALTSPQIACILALERICHAANLWIVCEQCARDLGTFSHLVTANGSDDPVWKIDCPCTERRFTRAGLQHSMIPSGDLLKVAETLLAGTKLVVRCPIKKTGCLTTPLDVTLETDGVTARCQCWQIDLTAGVYRFRKTSPLQ